MEIVFCDISLVYIHVYYNHRWTEDSPSKLKLKKKNAVRVPWLLFSLCFCLICFPYVYDHILAIFPWDPGLDFTCMLSLIPEHYRNRSDRVKALSEWPTSRPQGPLWQATCVAGHSNCALSETGIDTQWQHPSFSRWATARTQMCSVVLTWATSEILIDAMFMKILYFHHGSVS